MIKHLYFLETYEPINPRDKFSNLS